MENPDTAKKVAIKFLLSNSLTGSLIGSQGKSIKELITITGAKINVSGATDTYPGTADRVILLSGTKEAVSLAQTLIWEMIGLMSKHTAANNGDTRLVEWNPRAAFESLGTNDAVEVVARFTIPALAGGAILGKGGETIRSFATQSGARIAMSGKDEALFTQERIITVAGSVANCINCTDLVISKLAEVIIIIIIIIIIILTIIIFIDILLSYSNPRFSRLRTVARLILRR
jgi:RNA-binding protein Nova